MKTTLGIARLLLIGSGGLMLLLGLVIWTGNGDELIPVHVVVGAVLVVSLWTIATIAAISGVARPLAGVAVAWSVGVVAFGLLQERILEGDWHWAVQATHLLVSMAVVGWGQLLVLRVHRAQAPAVVAAQ